MDTAVVILNWNGLKFLQEYLPTLKKFSCSETASVVVADNGSTDGSLEWLNANHPDVRTIPLDKNYGFTGGYNRAMAVIDADYYVLINSDIEVTQGWLTTLIDFMEEYPDVGICQPKIRSLHNRDFFEYAGASGGFIDRFGYPFCRGRILSNIEKDNGQYDKPMEIFWATGACLVIRSSLFHHLGGLDERFFAHMEEIDLCWRAKLLGYQVWAVPSSLVYHVGGGTLPNDSPFKLYLNFRNNLLLLYKNLPEKIRNRRLFARKVLDGLSAVAFLLSGKKENFKAVLKAHKDYTKMVSEMEPSPFSDEKNNVGYYPSSIVLKFFVSGKKLTFDKLKGLV